MGAPCVLPSRRSSSASRRAITPEASSAPGYPSGHGMPEHSPATTRQSRSRALRDRRSSRRGVEGTRRGRARGWEGERCDARSACADPRRTPPKPRPRRRKGVARQDRRTRRADGCGGGEQACGRCEVGAVNSSSCRAFLGPRSQGRRARGAWTVQRGTDARRARSIVQRAGSGTGGARLWRAGAGADEGRA